ncbi:DUF3306 domain-containing protein [Shewanella japonica]|uniref:DUF3306 domain-containing protein n=1 Tax=Shewanella japonica TaxID=93973 RepID=UPI002493DB38|nr:DUF3306 domain-containing protein [Shewanella japonica]
MSDKPRGFFSRWTERREQVEAEAAADLAAKTQATETEQVSPEGDTETVDAHTVETAEPEKILEAEDLPDPEKIEVGGSFASFMGANVSPAAKSAALKALWKQPQYNEIDGLLEYALDYSNQPKLGPDVSAELAKKVFRNVMKDEDKAEDEALLASEGDDTVGDATDAPQEVLSEKSELVAKTDPTNQSDDLVMASEAEISPQRQV